MSPVDKLAQVLLETNEFLFGSRVCGKLTS